VSGRRVPVGRVGRPHGRDGSFYVEGASAGIEEGMRVEVAGQDTRVVRRAGTAERPLVRLERVDDRDAAAALRGEPLLASEAVAPLEDDEWLAEDLVGCRIEGLGAVRRVVAAPSCDLLEVGADGVLVPFVSDAIVSVDPAAGVIEVNRAFLGLEP
jgi:16S rRNA processing protein RimM